jgi:CheY-like chemotaxis protein
VLALLPGLQTDSRLPEDVREDLAIINRNVLLEARLIDDLLDLTRIAKGKIELHYGPVDLRALIEHTMQSFCHREATSKGLRVEQQLAEGSHIIQADGARLTQVLWNLVSNATKFTPPGGSIILRTRLEQVADAPWLALEVEDTGLGIEPDALGHIFESFEQGGSGITRKFGGLGLGLAISRAIVRLHRGTITAHSEGRDRGARFTVRLPMQTPFAVEGITAPGQAEELRAGTHRSAHVLLVEDHRDTARVLSRLLRRAGFHVTTVSTVAEAIIAADRAEVETTPNGQPLPIQLVLSDLGLPDGTGVELMRQLRRRHRMPGIALSGFGMEEDIRRTLDAGFDRHFTKPVDLERLIATIRELLSPGIVPSAGD